MYPPFTVAAAVDQDQHGTDQHHAAEEQSLTAIDCDPTAQEDEAPIVGRNCRINIFDQHEIERLNEELQDLQRWFEEYGQDGILFPHSVINSFTPRNYCQAA